MATKKKTKISTKHVSVILLVGIIVVFAIFIFNFVKLGTDKKQKEETLANLTGVATSQAQYNDDLKNIVEGKNQDEFVDKSARDEGYVKTDEHVYEDITPGSKN